MIQYGRQWIRVNAVGESRSEVTFWPARGDLMGVGLGTHPLFLFQYIDISPSHSGGEKYLPAFDG